MHYYSFNPKDYMSKTAFLEPMEDLAYRRMLDHCYLTELPLPEDVSEIAMLIRMRTHTESIKVVLHYFFELTSQGYVCDRIARELAAYHSKSEKAKASADARWSKQRNKIKDLPKDNAECKSDANALRDECERNANNKQITINQEPLTNIYNGAEENENSDPRFDLSLSDVNTRLSMAGLKNISQQDLNVLLIQLRDAYSHKKQMVKNQILGKAFEWVKRQQETPLKQAGQSITRTTSQILAEQRMQLDQQQGQVIDVGEPKKSLLIEEVGRA